MPTAGEESLNASQQLFLKIHLKNCAIEIFRVPLSDAMKHGQHDTRDRSAYFLSLFGTTSD